MDLRNSSKFVLRGTSFHDSNMVLGLNKFQQLWDNFLDYIHLIFNLKIPLVLAHVINRMVIRCSNILLE